MSTHTNAAGDEALHRGYIGGEWLPGGSVGKNINPSNTSDIVGLYARADAGQTEAAIDAARAAFPAWARMSPQVRFDALDKIGTEILARRVHLQVLRRRGAAERR